MESFGLKCTSATVTELGMIDEGNVKKAEEWSDLFVSVNTNEYVR